ncbi:hypothetical protein HDU67_006907 [Dinochytrium kinnereticum]|nr:hypothetical protein HDU67_006907 [Dinochytrium kinnereticum]
MSIPNEVIEQIVRTISQSSQPEEVRLNHLAACSKVSRLWYNVATPLMWHLVNPVQADTVRMLVVNGLKDGRPLAPTLSFNNRFSLIREIDLSRISIYNAEITSYIQPLLMNSLELRRLDLSNCLWIKDNDLFSLINCTKLEVLILRGCGNIAGDNLGLLLEHLPRLHTFSLSGCDMLHDLTSVFRSCQAPLRTVELTSLWGAADFSSGVFTLFQRCHRTLEDFTASSPHMGLSAFTGVHELPPMNLKRLRLDTSDGMESEAILRLLDHIENLESLNLCGTPRISAQALALIFERTSRLSFLDISYVDSVTDDTIDYLTMACPRITSLHARGCRKLTDLTLGSIALRLSGSLRSLFLDFNVNITPSGITGLLEQCLELEDLSLNFCSLFLGTAVERLAKTLGAEAGETEIGEGVMQFTGVRSIRLLLDYLMGGN